MNPDPGIQLPSGDEADEELEGPQGLATPPDEETRVVPVDVEDGPAHVLSIGVFEVDQGGYPHPLYEALQYRRRHADDVRGLLQDRHPDPGRLSPDAEDAGLALANYVDFDLGALDVELL